MASMYYRLGALDNEPSWCGTCTHLTDDATWRLCAISLERRFFFRVCRRYYISPRYRKKRPNSRACFYLHFPNPATMENEISDATPFSFLKAGDELHENGLQRVLSMCMCMSTCAPCSLSFRHPLTAVAMASSGLEYIQQSWLQSADTGDLS